MIYGILFGLSLTVGSLFGKPWWGAGIGLILGVIVLLSRKYGDWVVVRWKSWRSSRTTSTTTVASKEGTAVVKVTEVKVTDRWWWKNKGWVLWPAVIVLAVLLVGTYEGRKKLDETALQAYAKMNGGQVYEYQLTSTKPQEFTVPAAGRYKFDVLDQKEYRYRCPGWKGDRPGYLQKIDRPLQYAEPLENYPLKMVGYPGALLVWSEGFEENPLPSENEFAAGTTKVYVGLNLTESEKACLINMPAPVRILITPVS